MPRFVKNSRILWSGQSCIWKSKHHISPFHLSEPPTNMVRHDDEKKNPDWEFQPHRLVLQGNVVAMVSNYLGKLRNQKGLRQF